MHPDCQQDVVDKQPIGLIGTAERRQHQFPKAGQGGVDGTRTGLGPIDEVADAPQVGVVGDRVQRCTRQIKMKRVVWLVEESDRISFQVRDNDLAGTQVAHRRLLAVLPIFMMGKIAK
jgi:hypothetical protein